MRRPAGVLLTLTYVVLAACGPKSPAGEEQTSPGDTDSGSDTDPGTDTTPDTEDPCAVFEPDQDIGPAVEISLHHQGNTPVYYNPVGCGGAIPIAIMPEGGEPFGYRPGECFPVFCEHFLGQEDCSGGCDDCEGPPAARMDPAGMGESSWTGVMHTPLEMTAACAPGSQCQTTCLRADQAPTGTYEFELTVYTTCEGMCECDDPLVDGICWIWQSQPQLSDPVTITATLDYPAQTSVELVIDI